MKVGVVMPIGRESDAHIPGWDELRAVAEAAENGGLDSIWVFDHLLFRFPGQETEGIHEAWTVLAALAAITTRVELGILVAAMPFRNPALLAKMAATAEEVSGGRLILGVGTGWHEPEFDAFGYPFDHRVGRFEEALQILVPLVREGRVRFEGRYHRADAEIIPRYRRPDGRPTPILIAGRRPRMMRLVARYADAWNAAWLGPVAQLEPRVAPLREAMIEEGRDPSTIDITAGVNVITDPAAPVPDHALSGEPQELARELRAYADAGVAHVICALEPATPAGVERVAQAARLLRE
ncbi:MAG TPA: LLM class flavin-dependent oxidoreductase [Candidatus Limnocylindria bacterium]|nr:LLM class flavin-dependent oxidoreductase [Candidatus Limnocylindria bacterium]